MNLDALTFVPYFCTASNPRVKADECGPARMVRINLATPAVATPFTALAVPCLSPEPDVSSALPLASVLPCVA